MKQSLHPIRPHLWTEERKVIKLLQLFLNAWCVKTAQLAEMLIILITDEPCMCHSADSISDRTHNLHQKQSCRTWFKWPNSDFLLPRGTDRIRPTNVLVGKRNMDSNIPRLVSGLIHAWKKNQADMCICVIQVSTFPTFPSMRKVTVANDVNQPRSHDSLFNAQAATRTLLFFSPP